MDDMALLKQAHLATCNEVMAFIEREKVYGLGCGFVDITLLDSTCITPDAVIWTMDK